MPTRRRYTQRASRPRAQYLWENVNENTEAINDTVSTLTNLEPTDSGVTIDPIPGKVLVRVMGSIILRPSVLTADVTLRVAAGLARTTEQTFAGGAANLPRPDLDNPGWFWNKTVGWFFTQNADNQPISNLHVNKRGSLPLRGMDSLAYFILRNLSGVAINVTINLRVLYRLP